MPIGLDRTPSRQVLGQASSWFAAAKVLALCLADKAGAWLGLWYDADRAPLGSAFALIYNQSVGGGEQCVIAPTADVIRCVVAGAPLAHNDVAGTGELPAVEFYPQSLGL